MHLKKNSMTRTITKERTGTLHRLLAQASTITVVTHTRPDGDAVGSSLGIARFLQETFGKDVRTLFSNRWAGTLDFLFDDAGVASTSVYEEDPEACLKRVADSDLIICLDCSGFKRVEAMEKELAASKAGKVLIDHHREPETDQFDLVFSETEISSASELLFWVLMSLPEVGGKAVALPPFTLKALMTGMTTDTNNFANSVWPSTLEMASKALEAGTDREEIVDRVFRSYRENRLRITGFILKDRMTVLPEGVAHIVLFKEDLEKYGIREGDLESIVNIPLTVADIRMSVMLKEDNGLFRVSVRSKRGTSAYAFAGTYFHGGGHLQASGGKLLFPGDIADRSGAAEYIENAVKEFFDRKQ